MNKWIKEIRKRFLMKLAEDSVLEEIKEYIVNCFGDKKLDFEIVIDEDNIKIVPNDVYTAVKLMELDIDKIMNNRYEDENYLIFEGNDGIKIIIFNNNEIRILLYSAITLDGREVIGVPYPKLLAMRERRTLYFFVVEDNPDIFFFIAQEIGQLKNGWKKPEECSYFVEVFADTLKPIREIKI